VVRKNSQRRILAKRNIVTSLDPHERTLNSSRECVADSKRIQAVQHFDEGQWHDGPKIWLPARTVFAFEINLYWRILNENKRAARRAGRLPMYAYAAVARLTEPSASAGNVLS
jgi:hypothetical protein